jgi:hypothetical protein
MKEVRLMAEKTGVSVTGMLKNIMWHIRRFDGIYIPKALERYILEELEEDLFPYGFAGCDDREAYLTVRDVIASWQCGIIDLGMTVEERIMERYISLKESHLDLLAEMNKLVYGNSNGEENSDYEF